MDVCPIKGTLEQRSKTGPMLTTEQHLLGYFSPVCINLLLVSSHTTVWWPENKSLDKKGFNLHCCQSTLNYRKKMEFTLE